MAEDGRRRMSTESNSSQRKNGTSMARRSGRQGFDAIHNERGESKREIDNGRLTTVADLGD